MRKAFLTLALLAIMFSTTVYAQNETQPPPDPCANVVCNSPPTASCDGNSVKTYSSPGTCSAGSCSYSSSATNCPYGCSNGACKNFCDTTTCGTNSKTCPDGFVASCTKTCDRTAQACTNCEPSCQGHETAPTQNTTTGGGTDCTNIVCNAPPSPSCDGSSVKSYSSPGTCSAGSCSYPSSSYSCQYGCSNGVCNPANGTSTGGTSGGASGSNATNPCANIVCNIPPPSFCEGNSVKAYNSPGSCSNGVCSYPSFITSCPSGCSNGVCNPSSKCPTDTQQCPDGSVIRRTEPNCEFRCPSTTACGNNICESGEATYCPPCTTQPCPAAPCVQGTCPSDCPSQQQQLICPQGCECKYDERGNIVGTYCQSQPLCNYNGVCDKGEDTSCKDCISGRECPVNRQCDDGSTVNCYKKEFGCSCEPCPLSQKEIPEGCHQETDRVTGFIRVVCEQQASCQPAPQDVRIRCVDEGGTPRFQKDHSGCDVFQCDFGGQRTNSPVFASPVKCPSPEEVSHALEKCREFGLPGVIGFEGGCKIGKCVQERHKECRPSEEAEKQMKDACREKGGNPILSFDNNGCRTFNCITQDHCERELPKEVYDKCAEKGGQLIVKRDDGGCVRFTECVRRGETTESFVEDIKEVPSTTELLAIAFKLEDLKLELDKLARKTNDIADYYKSTGSSEEKRFRRVSDMFNSAKDKVDEIRTKLRERVEDIEVDDVLEIKQDLRYLKDVVMKDILFVMLGSGDEIEEIKSGATKNCGTDGSCFDRAFRVCQPLVFYPESRDGPLVEVTGLEGDSCVMHVTMDDSKIPAGAIPGINPPYEMTCKIQKYGLGVDNPETDVFPYCTGNLLELMKQFYGPGGQQGPGVPGECSGDECREYCGRGPEEAKKCLEHLGRMLPPEAKEYLTSLAEGRTSSGFGGGFGPRDREFERGEFEQRGEFREGEFREEFSGEFERSEFESRREFRQPPTTSTARPASRGACSGCLDNGVCDPGECSECADCIRR